MKDIQRQLEEDFHEVRAHQEKRHEVNSNLNFECCKYSCVLGRLLWYWYEYSFCLQLIRSLDMRFGILFAVLLLLCFIFSFNRLLIYLL